MYEYLVVILSIVIIWLYLINSSKDSQIKEYARLIEEYKKVKNKLNDLREENEEADQKYFNLYNSNKANEKAYSGKIKSLEDQLSIVTEKYQASRDIEYIAIYDSDIFENKILKEVYCELINAINTSEYTYPIIMQGLLYIDSLESPSLYFSEISFDNEIMVNEYNIFEFVSKLLSCTDVYILKHKSYIFATLIFTVIGFCEDTINDTSKKNKKRGYAKSRMIINELLAEYLNDEVLNDIIKLSKSIEADDFSDEDTYNASQIFNATQNKSKSTLMINKVSTNNSNNKRIKTLNRVLLKVKKIIK